MNIDFPPPSKGTYNNAGSSRKLCNYLEHEDMERMEQGIIYDPGASEIADEQAIYMERLWEFNQLRPSEQDKKQK